MDLTQALDKLLVYLVPVLCGIILHEIAHGYVAWLLGDPTARSQGRLSLNPIPHIDPAGLLVFVLTSLLGGFVFGWAKPVPVDPRYFRNPRRGMMLVAFAGPVTNFLLAILFALLLYASISLFPLYYLENNPVAVFFGRACSAGVYLNFALGWLNLIPIPPLDGSRIVAYFLPDRQLIAYMRLERYGFLILFLLLTTHVLNAVLSPLILGSAETVLAFLGLH